MRKELNFILDPFKNGLLPFSNIGGDHHGRWTILVPITGLGRFAMN